MNNKPIGVFDSGVGGLTVVREIMNLLPDETIIYLGDTANLPYGDKSTEIVGKYAVANTEFLLKYDIKVLVVACNTASSVALDDLKEHYPIPIIGVIEPAVKGALYATRNSRLGVIGTNRTIKSDVYPRLLKELDGNVEVFSRSCPLFVPLIEDNFIEHEATRLVAEEYLKDFHDKGIDALILGCTHYPLIRNIIAGVLPDVKLIDSASSTAKDLYSVLDTHHMLRLHQDEEDALSRHRFFTTDITEKFNDLARQILGMEIIFEEVHLNE